ncbi:hypothetical protein ACQKDS_19770 [Serratia sp. NPDC078593]|uniref:hypothetical protein n=1 Tax=unclassified Serratia (in: enterobacteria) TaxID=2647522 RepID=UPI0037D4E518
MGKFYSLLLMMLFYTLADFGGGWVSEGKSSTYTVHLTEVGNHIFGKYCFITNNGNRIDCAKQDDDDNIAGDIFDRHAQISFDSTFGGAGKAVLTPKEDNLIYHFTDKSPFVYANMSVPDEIVMKRFSK